MAELVNMPKLGFDMQEGQLVRWLKNVGDAVAKGDVLAEIESDKATIEVESYVTGTILNLLVNAGDWVPIGAPMAVVGQAGEQVDLAALGVSAAPAAATAPAPAKESKEATTASEPPRQPTSAPVAVPAPDGGGNGHGLPEGVRASPLARRMASEIGLDLARITGSGPMGRITKSDVEAFKSGTASASPASARPSLAVTPVRSGPDDEAIPTPRIRTRIAARMVESKSTVPHFYVTSEIDMKAAMALRAELNERRADDDKISVNDLIVKAAALALRDFPNLNSSFNGDTIIRHNRINVGIAVALDVGLINVVSKDSDVTPLTVMATTHREMVARARDGKVKPEDVEGETFAVSNLGAFDVEHFVAIINPPSAAILAVGSAGRVPVVEADGSLGVGWRMKATLSADHRVTDGVEAARFMQALKAILEDPLRLLM